MKDGRGIYTRKDLKNRRLEGLVGPWVRAWMWYTNDDVGGGDIYVRSVCTMSM